MKISHVIRGAEWLSTFPLHIHIYNAFGWEQPVWVHLSVFLKPSGKGKMSKRESAQLKQDGYSIFIKDLRELGYIPEGVVNWISLMGWSYDDHTEFFTMQRSDREIQPGTPESGSGCDQLLQAGPFQWAAHPQPACTGAGTARKIRLRAAGYNVANADIVKVAEATQVRIVTLEDAVPMAGFFFEDEVHPNPRSWWAKT